MSDEWMTRAACKNAPPDLFFPDRGLNATGAYAVCKSCKVSDDCLEYALDHGIEHGIWGGLSEKQRRKAPSKKWCSICGSRFQPKHGLERLCSDVCRASARAATATRSRRRAA